MITKPLDDLLRRAQDWPEGAQEELTRLGCEIETELARGAYHAAPEELAGIDRGLRDSAEGEFATGAEVEAILAKRRAE